MKRLLLWPLLSAALALLVCLFIPPTFTATATIDVRPSARAWAGQEAPMPPMAMPLARYAALLESRRVADRIIRQFDLQAVYGEPTLAQTRERLAKAVRIGRLKGDLLIVQASDRYPWRAADLANQYAEELQRLLDELRMEAAHARADRLNAEVRRVERDLAAAHERLQASRLDPGQLRLDARLAMGQQAGLQQSLRAARQRLAVLRANFQDDSAEVLGELAQVAALREQLGRIEAGSAQPAADGILYADAARDVRQLEPWLQQLKVLAVQAEFDAGVRVEALLGVDPAKVPERPSAPAALLYMAAAWGITLAGLLVRARQRRKAGYRRSGGTPFKASTSLA